MVQAPRPNAGRRENDLFFWGEKKLPKKNIFFLHISSSYAKILGETNFHAREIPRSGLKVEGVEERKKERKKRKKWVKTMASFASSRPHYSGQACKHCLQAILPFLWFWQANLEVNYVQIRNQ